MRTRLRVLGATTAAAVVAITIPLVTSSQAQAARFAGGDVVVYRVGTGAAALDNSATPVFLDEYDSAGNKLQSLALPTTASDGNHRLTAAGESRSEGLIDRSGDGRYLVVTGYDAAVGATGAAASGVPGGHLTLAATDPTAVPRVVGLVDANGTVDTTTELKSAGDAQIIRSATTTDGQRLWATGGNGGIVTVARGAATSTLAAGTATSNFSSLSIQGGQLFTSGILADRLAAVSPGTVTDLTGLPSNLLTYGYAFAAVSGAGAGYGSTGLNTLYIANGSERGGTIDKYQYNGTTWVSVGYVDVPGAFGVVASTTGNTVSLAVTTPTQLITFSDTNASAADFSSAGSRTVLATAATNTEFRGVALAPTSAAGPSVFIHQPAVDGTVPLGGTVPVTAYVDGPSGVSSVQAKLGNGAYVTATKASTGHLWTAQVPTTGLTAGSSTVTVQATDNAGTPGTTTSTQTVTLSGVAAPAGSLAAGSYAGNAKQIKVKGTWTTYKTKHSPSGKGRSSTKKKSTATAVVWGHGLTLTFDRSAKAGKVKVTVDGRSTTLDLFNSAGKPLSKTWSFAGALKTHQVVVTVLGTKNAHSKGTAVLFAALKVKA